MALAVVGYVLDAADNGTSMFRGDAQPPRCPACGFGSGDELSPLVLVGPGVAAALRRARLRGLDLLPVPAECAPRDSNPEPAD